MIATTLQPPFFGGQQYIAAMASMRNSSWCVGCSCSGQINIPDIIPAGEVWSAEWIVSRKGSPQVGITWFSPLFLSTSRQVLLLFESGCRLRATLAKRAFCSFGNRKKRTNGQGVRQECKMTRLLVAAAPMSDPRSALLPKTEENASSAACRYDTGRSNDIPCRMQCSMP